MATKKKESTMKTAGVKNAAVITDGCNPELIKGAYFDRFYETSQLETAAKIKSYRQLGLSIDEIKAVLSGTDVKYQILKKRTKTEK